MGSVIRNMNICFVAAFTMLNASIAIGQVKTKVDSLLRQAKLDIYEKPESVIKLGDSIYNSPGATLEIKVDALMIISDAYSSKRDYQKSLKYFQIANELSKNANNVKQQILVLSRMGVRYQQMKVYDKAIQCLDECDKLIAENAGKVSIGNFVQATNYVVRGFIYKEQLNCDIAINYFNKGIDEFNKDKSTVKEANLSIAYYNKGNCYALLGNKEEAKKSYFEAIKKAEQVNANSLKAFAQKGLAEVYTGEGEYQKSIDIQNEALSISKNVGDLVLNRGLYLGLANNYKAINNWAEYQKYNRLFLQDQYLTQESERRSTSDSIDELADINNNKLDKIRTKYYIVILLEILVFLTLIYMLFAYHFRSKKSMIALNLEMKRIKESLKKETQP
jgi:tetratricopeptide (TPR) repeat protein